MIFMARYDRLTLDNTICLTTFFAEPCSGAPRRTRLYHLWVASASREISSDPWRRGSDSLDSFVGEKISQGLPKVQVFQKLRVSKCSVLFGMLRVSEYWKKNCFPKVISSIEFSLKVPETPEWRLIFECFCISRNIYCKDVRFKYNVIPPQIYWVRSWSMRSTPICALIDTIERYMESLSI